MKKKEKLKPINLGMDLAFNPTSSLIEKQIDSIKKSKINGGGGSIPVNAISCANNTCCIVFCEQDPSNGKLKCTWVCWHEGAHLGAGVKWV